TVYPAYYNIAGRAINFSSLIRWDAEKRRTYADVSMPVEKRADRVVHFFVDGRNENWNLSQTPSGLIASVSDLNLRRLEAGIEFRFVQNGNWSWTAGSAVIGRRFQNVTAGLIASAKTFFTNGTSLDSWVGARRSLLRVPERRFKLEGKSEVHFGRGFKEALGPFGKVGGALEGEWLRHSRGEDDALHFRIRSASVFGTVPLDQLYELGLDRDSEIWLRGHKATIGGKKGPAP